MKYQVFFMRISSIEFYHAKTGKLGFVSCCQAHLFLQLRDEARDEILDDFQRVLAVSTGSPEGPRTTRFT